MVAFRWILLAVVMAGMAGCCACPPKETRSLPAAITAEEQARRLADWSRRLPRIEATGGVGMEYRDDKGGAHAVSADGTLRIQQHWETATSTAPRGAEVLLTGRVIDQPAFEAGRNATNWWFAVKGDQKEAWVGDARQPIGIGTLGAEGSASVLRADLVPELLGMTALPGRVLYLVDDPSGTNRLFILAELLVDYPSGSTTRPIVAREIVVDRYTGHVSEVRLYNMEGVVVVRSELSKYAPVAYAEGVARPAAPPEFPRKVVVQYPGRSLTVSLTFDDVEVVGEFKPAVFAMPDFGRQGLKVIPGD